MTDVISYNQAVLEIREETANREHFIVSGNANDMASVIRSLGNRRCTVWINADSGPVGVFKISSTDVSEVNGLTVLINIVTAMTGMQLGIAIAVPKVDGLPEKLAPKTPGKDLISINDQLPVMVAEAMRTIWPDSTVLTPEETVKAVSR